MRKPLLLLSVLLASLAAMAAPSESEKLHAMFDEEWEWQLRDDPEGATIVGDKRYDDRLTDRSPAAYERRRTHNRRFVERAGQVDRTRLTDADKLNLDLFMLRMQTAAEQDLYPWELLPINQMEGIQALLTQIAQQISWETVKDHENFLARMRAYPRAVDETIALMKRGAAMGLTPPRIVLRDLGELIAHQIVDDPTRSPIYQLGFTNFRSSIPPAEQERLQKEAREVLMKEVLPAMRKLDAYWRDEYYPRTREAIAWTSVPQGKEWYAFLVRMRTTTGMTPDQIHALGLSEVRRIHAEMEKIKSESGFTGTLKEFFTFLRTDPRFYYGRREDLLDAYRSLTKRVDPELTRLFGRLPRLPYGVVPIPEYAEKTQTTAYYNPGSPEGNRPGYYFVNLYDLKSRPKWEMEALSLHEAVPGHHLQFALTQELDELPEFRRWSVSTAYVEGWGLYAESLGPELGMYKDPYSRFGQLTYQMWRAVRLVVDTGMHSKGWTRQQAIDYFVENSSKPLHDIEVEIDRYISWPAQALAYKIGELKIKELRARAEREMGAKFDVRQFHDAVLGAGPLPLSLLEARVNQWIRSNGGAKATITVKTGGAQ